MLRSTFTIASLFITVLLTPFLVKAQTPAKRVRSVYYSIKIYHLKDESQIAKISDFLRDSYLPAMHRLGQKQLGVFLEKGGPKFGTNIYVLNDLATDLDNVDKLEDKLFRDSVYVKAFNAYNQVEPKTSFYDRIEVITLRAFPKMTFIEVPKLRAAKSKRVYELRSYESPTEAMNLNKVKMFNDGNEVALFKRLDFHAVFYSEVISGSHMPNLMYMVTFEDMADHDAKWKAFGADPEWKKLSALPEYQNNVNNVDAHFLTPMDYSDL